MKRHVLNSALIRLAGVLPTLVLTWSCAQPATAVAAMVHPLLDIQDALVSEASPPRSDGSLDVARCARLHNYLVALSWMERHGKGPEHLDELLDPARPSYTSTIGDREEQIRARVDPQLWEFLSSVVVPGADEEHAEFYVWVSGLAHPAEFEDQWTAQAFNAEDEETEDGLPPFQMLYPMNYYIGSHRLGVVYHQALRRVAYVNTIFDTDYVHPVEERGEWWVPLELLLSHWVAQVQRGKVTTGPRRWACEGDQGVWRVEAYGRAQVASTLAAFDRLVSAIEERMRPDALLDLDGGKPLLTDADLDAAGAPADCFARVFLTQARTPRFSRLAPGIEVPHDAAVFASQQTFTRREIQHDDSDDDGPIHPAVLLFAAAGGRTVNFDSPSRYINYNPFVRELHLAAGNHSTPAGLYSESVRLGTLEAAGEGFRLLLPFPLQGGDHGAKRSDGFGVERGSVGELFQHGARPLGGIHEAQRLERLFGAWRGLVERGVWTVGRDGVEGSIERFGEADGPSWSDYWIPIDLDV